jgi:integrase/recombinase XerD
VTRVADLVESGPALDPSAEDYLTWLAVERGRARNTIVAYRRDLLAYEEFLRSSGLFVSDATRTAVERHLAQMARAGSGAGSRARALTSIRGLYRFRAEEGLGDSDPTFDLVAPRVGQRLPKAISEAEVLTLLESAGGSGPRDLRDRAMLELLYGTGMRVGELVGLSLGDIGSDSGLIRVLGKGHKERLVPLGRFAATSLDRWLDQGGRPELVPRRWARKGDSEALFINARGGRLTRQGVWEVIAGRARSVGLGEKVHPHVLRHSCATHMLARGADVRVVQELLGHASVSTTQVYTKVTVEHLRGAYEAAHPRSGGRAKRRRVEK